MSKTICFCLLLHHMANCHDKKDVAIIAHHQTVNETLLEPREMKQWHSRVLNVPQIDFGANYDIC